MSISRESTYIALGIMGFVLPLAFVAVAAAYSQWFNLVDNALSDLGHATKSEVAPIFNLGLSLGGFIVGVYAICYVLPASRLFGCILAFSGYSLVLVAVFDEVYGILHFTVSVIFFLSLTAFMVTYAVCNKSWWAALGVVAGVVSWVLHFNYVIPRGAAIPELVSIAAFIPFYVKLLDSRRLKVLNNRKDPSCGGPAGI